MIRLFFNKQIRSQGVGPETPFWCLPGPWDGKVLCSHRGRRPGATVPSGMHVAVVGRYRARPSLEGQGSHGNPLRSTFDSVVGPGCRTRSAPPWRGVTSSQCGPTPPQQKKDLSERNIRHVMRFLVSRGIA